MVSAQAFITGQLETPLLSAYKLYIGGELVDLGPGRGEAVVWGGDGEFRATPYTTLDVSSFFAAAGTATVAIEAMYSRGATVVMQLQVSPPPCWPRRRPPRS